MQARNKTGMLTALSVAGLLVACSSASGSPSQSTALETVRASLQPSADAPAQTSPPPVASPSARASDTPSGKPTTRPAPSAQPSIGPRPQFAVGDLLMTVSDSVVVRSKPRVSADSIIYMPWLPRGVALEVLKGPVAASGYWWYRVELRDGLSLNGGITAGWVAAADHDGEAWIDLVAVGTEPEPEPDYADLPTPELTVGAAEAGIGGDGRPYTYFDLSVVNWADYPAELFASSPDLPPCGLNSSASRTWVDIIGVDSSEDKSRIYGFCALGGPEGLTRMWFAVPQGSPPPPFVYVTLWDRLDDRIVVSRWVKPPWPLPTPTSSASPTTPPPSSPTATPPV